MRNLIVSEKGEYKKIKKAKNNKITILKIDIDFRFMFKKPLLGWVTIGEVMYKEGLRKHRCFIQVGKDICSFEYLDEFKKKYNHLPKVGKNRNDFIDLISEILKDEIKELAH